MRIKVRTKFLRVHIRVRSVFTVGVQFKKVNRASYHKPNPNNNPEVASDASSREDGPDAAVREVW